uniref:Uncharacterized protein n=1 Tax=Anguilla anguilla TaxID=7936 RepID=A0A0E9TEG5_ANGAN
MSCTYYMGCAAWEEATPFWTPVGKWICSYAASCYCSPLIITIMLG